jgi:hypothetical protein
MQNTFLSFIHAAFGDDHDLLAHVQLIAGRLFLPQCNAAQQVYFHGGDEDSGAVALICALAAVFQGRAIMGAENDVEGNAAYFAKHGTRIAIRHGADNKWVGSFKVMSISRAFIKHQSALTRTQTHVAFGSAPCAERIFTGDMQARVTFINWPRIIPQEMRTPEFAKSLAQDPDFIIWLAEGLRRAQTIDKMQQTIDRPAADIVLSDEPSE